MVRAISAMPGKMNTLQDANDPRNPMATVMFGMMMAKMSTIMFQMVVVNTFTLRSVEGGHVRLGGESRQSYSLKRFLAIRLSINRTMVSLPQNTTGG